MTETLYEPTGKSANEYAPLASVVVDLTGTPNTLVTADPSAFVIDNVTPAIPGSPESLIPSRSLSTHTKLPTETRGETKPKSRVMSLVPFTVKFVDVASPVDESIARSPPTDAVVGT